MPDYTALVSGSKSLALEQERESEILRFLEQKRKEGPHSVPASIVHGATLGYGGEPPTNLWEYIASMGGSMLPYGLAAAAVGPAVPVVARLLGAGSTAGKMAVHGGLTGLAAGTVEKQDTLEDRLKSMALQTGLGAAVPYGIGRWRAGRVAQGAPFDVDPKANLPGGFSDPNFKSITYPQGAFSAIPTTEQLSMPFGEPKAASARSLGIVPGLKPTTVESTGVMGERVTRQIPDELGFSGGTRPPVVKPPQQLPLYDDSLKLMGGDRGWDVSPNPTGFSAVGPGGRVEHFPDAATAHNFLSEQSVKMKPPVIDYGTFEKAVNYDWMVRPNLTPTDKAALSFQAAITQIPKVSIGSSLSGGVAKLEGRARLNVITGITGPEELATAQRAVVEAGYKPWRPLTIGDTIELPYATKWDRDSLTAIKTYNTLRTEGPRGPRDLDNIYKMGSLFGKNQQEMANYVYHNILEPAAGDIKVRRMLLGQLTRPQGSQSPIVSQITSDVQMARAQNDNDIAVLNKTFRDAYFTRLTPEQLKMSAALVEGVEYKGKVLDFSKQPLEVQNAANAWRSLMAEFAELKGIPQWREYATHVTDTDALWSATRQSILKDTAWAKKKGLSSGDLDRLKEYAGKYTGGWFNVPSEIREFIEKTAFQWDVSGWSKLPTTIKAQLPEEIFNRFMLPRVGGDVPYHKDILKMYDAYVPTTLRDINFSPVLEKVKPLIDALPGIGDPLSERTWLTNFINLNVLNKPMEITKSIRGVTQELQQSLGAEMANPRLIDDLITLYRGRQYGGFLSIDSAFRHFNKIINTFAENGKYLGYSLKHLPDIAMRRGIPQIPGVTKMRGSDIEERLLSAGANTLTQKAIKISDTINTMSLYPMQQVENVMRGFSFKAGFEEAAQLGLNTKDAIRFAFRKASKYMPDITMTEAQWSAYRNTMKTDFGYDLAQAPPIFSHPLVRLSTLFMTYPTRQVEFLSKGVASSLNGFFNMAKSAGYEAAIETIEQGKLFRYLAATGFLFGGAYHAAKLGVDLTNFLGQHMMRASFPFWQGAINVYAVLRGEDPYSTERARKEIKEALMGTVVPQYRTWKKAGEASDALRRGYNVDEVGRYIHDSTPFGEFMNFLGIPPTQYTNAKKIAKEWTEVARDYSYERHSAIEEMLRTGKPDSVQEFTQKWGRPIEPKDIQRYIEEYQATPQQRAVKTLPYEVLQKMADERPYLFGRGV